MFELEYEYLHGNDKPFYSLGFGNIDMVTHRMLGIKWIKGYDLAMFLLPLIILVQLLIVAKKIKAFQKIGDYLDHIRTYYVIIVAVAINLFLIDLSYPKHHVTFYLRVGAYIYFSLICLNVIARLYKKVKNKA